MSDGHQRWAERTTKLLADFVDNEKTRIKGMDIHHPSRNYSEGQISAYQTVIKMIESEFGLKGEAD